MLNKFTKSGLKSPFAYCMLIRIASKLLDETEGGWVDVLSRDTISREARGRLGPRLEQLIPQWWLIRGLSFHLSSHDSPLFDFIESCLRNKNEMVVYEAASAIVHMPNCTARELAPAVSGPSFTHFSLTLFVQWCFSDIVKWLFVLHANKYQRVCVPAVLQLFCSSPKAALRYAAVRTLNKVQLHSVTPLAWLVYLCIIINMQNNSVITHVLTNTSYLQYNFILQKQNILL